MGLPVTWALIPGDCLDAMRAMPPASVDAIATDPPYGLGFMGREWDAIPPGIPWAQECLRVLKPGGHLVAFGGTRTYHRLACAVEDAGFEIRDQLAWMYGSGFPKSLDVSKAIDRAAGAEREVVGIEDRRSAFDGGSRSSVGHSNEYGSITNKGDVERTAPATPDAEQWQGWGTALKPAYEPIVLARKPLVGTVAGNVLAHGTGALNVDGCRIGDTVETWPSSRAWGAGYVPGGDRSADRTEATGAAPAGRWPANVLLDGVAASLLDEQTGELSSGALKPYRERHENASSFRMDREKTYESDANTGGASRFFYVAKASSRERNAGLDGFEERMPDNAIDRAGQRDGTEAAGGRGSLSGPRANVHPTVKPVEVMRWLVRLITPPGGTVLDPFCGSGTTGCAAVLEGFDFIGCEREPEYCAIADARIAWWAKHKGEGTTDEVLEAAEARHDIEAGGQLDIFGEVA